MLARLENAIAEISAHKFDAGECGAGGKRKPESPGADTFQVI
jgi:hypothetical protein